METQANNDALVPLNQTDQLVPMVGDKPAVHYATLHRWCTRGLLGIILEHVRIGGKLYTTRANVQRFIKHVEERRTRQGATT